MDNLTEAEQAIAYRLVGQLHLRALLAEAKAWIAESPPAWSDDEEERDGLLKRIDEELNR